MSGPRALACPRCGSDRLRRAHAHRWSHRLVRRLTPYRRFACLTCGHRGWTGVELPRTPPRAGDGDGGPARPPVPGRPLERRDRAATWRERRRIAGSILLAVALAFVAAERLVSCEAERPPPAAE